MSNLDKAHEHIKAALDETNGVFTPESGLIHAIIAATYSNMAILDFIRERENRVNPDIIDNSVCDVEGRDSQS